MTGTVSIGCKLPSGLKMSVFAMEPRMVPVLGGGMKEVQEARFIGSVPIRGTGRRIDDPRIVGNYAITHNVDADVWAEWLRANKDSDLVKSDLIFAYGKLNDTEAHARDSRSVRSGLEPVDPDNLPSEFKRSIKTADVAK